MKRAEESRTGQRPIKKRRRREDEEEAEGEKVDEEVEDEVEEQEEAPYSSDMTPCDFFLFPRLKLPRRGIVWVKRSLHEDTLLAFEAIPEPEYYSCLEN